MINLLAKLLQMIDIIKMKNWLNQQLQIDSNTNINILENLRKKQWIEPFIKMVKNLQEINYYSSYIPMKIHPKKWENIRILQEQYISILENNRRIQYNKKLTNNKNYYPLLLSHKNINMTEPVIPEILEEMIQDIIVKNDFEIQSESQNSDTDSVSSSITPYTTEYTVNRGTGAGGSNTNLYGKKFEDVTNNERRLMEDGYTKTYFENTKKKTQKENTKKKPQKEKPPKNPSKKTYDYYLSKTYENKTVIFVLQNALKIYMKQKYNIELFRCPDEAYIFEHNDGTVEIKILEKKEQRVEGSVETKLWSGPSLLREYEIVLGEDKFKVEYGFCVSSFLKNKFVSGDKKYTVLKQILRENKIVVLFGEDADYFERLDEWLGLGLDSPINHP